MYRGTTPTVVLTVDGMDLTALKSVYVTFSQSDGSMTKKSFTKRNGDPGFTVASDAVTVKLTQKDTLNFSAPGNVQVQMRGLMPDGTAVASSIKNFSTQQILLEGEIQ